MATLNTFDLLGDDAEDPSQLAVSIAPPEKTDKSKKSGPTSAAAKVSSKQLPPSQAVREARSDAPRGGGRGFHRGRVGPGGYNRDFGRDDGPGGNNEYSGGYSKPSEGGDVSKSSYERRGGGYGGAPRGSFGGGRRGEDGEGERPRRAFERRSGTGRGETEAMKQGTICRSPCLENHDPIKVWLDMENALVPTCLAPEYLYQSIEEGLRRRNYLGNVAIKAIFAKWRQGITEDQVQRMRGIYWHNLRLANPPKNAADIEIIREMIAWCRRSQNKPPHNNVMTVSGDLLFVRILWMLKILGYRTIAAFRPGTEEYEFNKVVVDSFYWRELLCLDVNEKGLGDRFLGAKYTGPVGGEVPLSTAVRKRKRDVLYGCNMSKTNFFEGKSKRRGGYGVAREGSVGGGDFKRGGSGRGNWGTPGEEAFAGETEEVAGVETEKDAVEKPAVDDVAADANKENTADVEEEKEPESKEMTLDEYEKLLEEKKKALQSQNTSEWKVDTKEFESMQQLSNKKSNDEIFSKGSDKYKPKDDKEEKAKKAVSISEFLKPAEGENYYRGGRGRGGLGAGGVSSGGFGGYRNEAAPAIGDTAQFPSLGGK